jgi:hypothetical protein
MATFIQWAAVANILSGVLLLTFWSLFAVLLPYRQLADTLSILVMNRYWVLVNLFGVTGAIAGLFGLVGIFVSLGDHASALSLFGFVLAFLGTVLILGTLLWDTVIWPILANHDPKMLDFQGPIYSSKTFLPFFITAGLLYSVGYLLFGLAIANSAAFPAGTGWLLAAGGPLFGLGPLFGKLQVFFRTVGIVLLSAGLIWLGFVM